MVYVNTFLGVLIDHKLKWKQHIKMITSKLSKTIAIMNRTKYILDNNARLILYYSLFLPYMSYCCEVWGNTYKSNVDSMHVSATEESSKNCLWCRTAHTEIN